jgi:hypothetical protein
MDTGQGEFIPVNDNIDRFNNLVRRANIVANDDKLFEQEKQKALNYDYRSSDYISYIDEHHNDIFFMAAVIRLDKDKSYIGTLNYIFGNNG